MKKFLTTALILNLLFCKENYPRALALECESKIVKTVITEKGSTQTTSGGTVSNFTAIVPEEMDLGSSEMYAITVDGNLEDNEFVKVTVTGENDDEESFKMINESTQVDCLKYLLDIIQTSDTTFSCECSGSVFVYYHKYGTEHNNEINSIPLTSLGTGTLFRVHPYTWKESELPVYDESSLSEGTYSDNLTFGFEIITELETGSEEIKKEETEEEEITEEKAGK